MLGRGNDRNGQTLVTAQAGTACWKHSNSALGACFNRFHKPAKIVDQPVGGTGVAGRCKFLPSECPVGDFSCPHCQ